MDVVDGKGVPSRDDSPFYFAMKWRITVSCQLLKGKGHYKLKGLICYQQISSKVKNPPQEFLLMSQHAIIPKENSCDFQI